MKKETKKRVIVAVMLLIFVMIATIFIYVKRDVEPVIAESEHSFEVSSINKDEEFILGIIGDSWVNNNKLDSSITDALKSSELNVNVQSYSLPGRKSGEIFEDMTYKNNEFNSNDVVQDESVDALLIVAGVNDTAGHFGSDYYVQSINNIISYANSNDKFVYILEVPEYGIEEKESFLSGVKHNIYKFVNDGGKRNIIKDYRTELRSQLKENEISGYAIIEYPKELDDYHSNINLYKDQFHLNDEGSVLLGEKIGEEIAKDVTR